MSENVGQFTGNGRGIPTRELENLTASVAVTASHALFAERIGHESASVGSDINPIYLNSGSIVPSTGTVGNASRSVYLDRGVITPVDPKVLTIKKGVVPVDYTASEQKYNTTGSDVLVYIPTTASHIGAVAQDAFDIYSASVSSESIAVSQSISGSLNNISSSLSASIYDVSASISGTFYAISESISGSLNSVSTSLSASIYDVSASISGTLYEVSRSVSGSLNTVSESISQSLSASISASTAYTSASISDLSASVGEISASISESIHNASASISRSITVLSSSVGQISSSISGTLSSVSQSISGSISDLSSSVGIISGSFHERVSKLTSSVNWVSNNSGNITSVTSSLMEWSRSAKLQIEALETSTGSIGGKSGSWDSAAEWAGEHSGSLNSVQSEVTLHSASWNRRTASLAISESLGPVTAASVSYAPDGPNKAINITVPGTASHIGAVAQNAFESYTASTSQGTTELSESISASICEISESISGSLNSVSSSLSASIYDVSASISGTFFEVSESISQSLSASVSALSHSVGDISASINTRIDNERDTASANLSAYSESIADTINKVRTESGSWDAAKDWTGENSGTLASVTSSLMAWSESAKSQINALHTHSASVNSKSSSWDTSSNWVGSNSGNLATFTSSLKSLKVAGGAFSVSDYNPTASADVTVTLPSTASHLGAVASDQTASMTAGTASRLNTNYDAGSTSKPVYFTDGRPSEVTSIEGIPVTASTLRSNGDATIAGNLVVEGTASFRNRHDLVVGDTVILLASGSTTRDLANGGGFAVQTASATSVGDAEKNAARIQYEAGNNRFTSSVAFAAPGFSSSAGFTGSLLGTASHASQVPWSGSLTINKILGTQTTQSITWSENSNSLKTFDLVVPGTASHIGAVPQDAFDLYSASASEGTTELSESFSQSLSASYSASIAYTSASVSDLSASVGQISSSINTRINNEAATASANLDGYSSSVAVTVEKVRAESGSWDAARTWVGANSGNLATFTSSLKSLKISTGSVNYKNYNPTASGDVSIVLPSTASHLGAVAQDVFNEYSASASVNFLEVSESISASIYSVSASISGTLFSVSESISGSLNDVSGNLSASVYAVSASISESLGEISASISASIYDISASISGTLFDASRSISQSLSASKASLTASIVAASQSLSESIDSLAGRLNAQSAGTVSRPIYISGGVPYTISRLEEMPVTASTFKATSNANITGYLKVQGGITGSLEGTASQALTASNAKFSQLTQLGEWVTASIGNETRYVRILSASYASASSRTDGTASYALNSDQVKGTFKLTGSVSATYNGSNDVTVTIPNPVDVIEEYTGSIAMLAESASHAAQAENADKLDGVHLDGIFTGLYVTSSNGDTYQGENPERHLGVQVGTVTKTASLAHTHSVDLVQGDSLYMTMSVAGHSASTQVVSSSRAESAALIESGNNKFVYDPDNECFKFIFN